jgi:hypothetical protein
MFYLFVHMLRVFLHAFCKSKFLHACIQPYNFFHKDLHVSLEVDVVFFIIEGLRDVYSYFFLLKVDIVNSSTNLSIIPQSLTHYHLKVISKFPQLESHFGILEM